MLKHDNARIFLDCHSWQQANELTKLTTAHFISAEYICPRDDSASDVSQILDAILQSLEQRRRLHCARRSIERCQERIFTREGYIVEVAKLTPPQTHLFAHRVEATVYRVLFVLSADIEHRALMVLKPNQSRRAAM